MDEYGNAILKIAALLATGGRIVADFLARERARTGKTTAEIFAEAGIQIDENGIALIEDMARYNDNPVPV